MSPISVVFSRYNEDMSYIENVSIFSNFKIIIYNKGNKPLPTSLLQKPNVQVIPLPNVGCECHTYLYHIIQNYDHLDDIILFLPGSCYAHPTKWKKTCTLLFFLMNRTRSTFLCAPEKPPQVIWNFTISEYGFSSHENREVYSSDKLNPSPIRPFGKWYEHIFGKDFPLAPITYNGIFAVQREHIHHRSVDFYKNLIQYVNRDIQNECVHYMERSWLAIFHPLPPECKIHYSC